MKPYNDICSRLEGEYMNTGFKTQCLEAVTVMLFLAKDSFSFASIADFKDKDKWLEAIKARDIVPLFELYELTNANTDDTYYESRNFRKLTQKASKVVTAELYLSICADRALRSYANSEYTRVFEATEDGAVVGVVKDDGSVRGQLLKSLEVGIRQGATVDKPPTTMISLNYADYEELVHAGVITKPNFDPVLDLSGIFEITLDVITHTATLVEFKAYYGCGKNVYANIQEPDILFIKDSDSLEQGFSNFSYDAINEKYVGVGVGLESGVLSLYDATPGSSSPDVAIDWVTGDFVAGQVHVEIP